MAAELLLATGNRGKEAEIRALLPGIALRNLRDLPHYQPPPEDSETFAGNAQTKAASALAAAQKRGMPVAAVLAEDSGLLVEALGGDPGVRSARFAGEHADDDANNRKLLEAMSAVPTALRGARFVAVMVLLSIDGEILWSRGELCGRIAGAPAGTEGFGYDPLFQPEGYDATLAQLGPDIKASLSHRARALKALLPHLRRLLQT